MRNYSSIFGAIFRRFGSHLGIIWVPIREDLAPLGELWGSQAPKIGGTRGIKMQLGSHFGAKRGFRSNLGWILNGFGTPGDPKMDPRKAWKPSRSLQNPP